MHKNYIKILLILLFLGTIFQSNAQENTPFAEGKKYILADVEVTGKISYNQQTVVTFAGLEKGQIISVPGEEISNAIKKLGKLGLFNEIDFYINKMEGDSIFLQLNINELPKLSEVKFEGVKKSKTEVHHIDGNWRNNEIENLQEICRSCHTIHHRNE